MEKLEWISPEYEEKEHSNDWFWALGTIVVCGSLASIIYANYFFAVLLIIGGSLLGFFAIKKPEMVPHELGEKGLKIGKRLFPYENIKSFYVRTDEKPVLLIHSERVFLPIISVPIEPELTGKIKEIMLANNIAEEEMKEHSSEKVMDSLGF